MRSGRNVSSAVWLQKAVTLKETTLNYSDEENEMNNAAPVLTSSEMRNIMKSMYSHLDAHFSGEMNNKVDDIE
ncbi:hypothetical protein TNCV_1367391 [Trichonephila clavipes]|nr:hypothetical protein TNCV_1367391 [Trichonephila clavipes]